MKTLGLTIFLLIFFINTNAQNVIDINENENKIVYNCAPCGCEDDGKYFDSPGQCPSCMMPLQATYTGIKRDSSAFVRRTVAILLFDGADIMDVTGPWSVFEHAGMSVVTVAKDSKAKGIGRTLEIKPDFTFENLPDVDVIVLPGGGPAEMHQDTAIVDWVKNRAGKTETFFSVCSGAFFLGLAGLLDGNDATTFASLIPDLRNQFPKANVLNDVKYTDNGSIITSAGLSSGIDASFQVVAKYYGEGRAQDVANHMEYPWSREKDYARTQLADNFIVGVRELVRIFSTKYLSSNGGKDKWEYRYQLSDQVPSTTVMNLIDRELMKQKNWLKENANKNLIEGIIEHPILGKGKVNIKIESSENGKTAIIKAERISS